MLNGVDDTADRSASEDPPSSSSTAGGVTDPAPARLSRRRRGLVLLAAGVLLLGWMGWVAFRMVQAADHLSEAREQVSRMRPLLADPTDIDISAVRADVTHLQASTASAVHAADDPLVRATRWLPFIGDDLTAVAEVAHATDSIAVDVLPKLLSVGQLDLSTLLSSDGRVDLTPLVAAAPDLVAADDAARRTADRLADLDSSSLLSPIASGVVQLRQQLVELTELTATGATMGRVVDGLFGEGSSRTVLVMIQNPAEPRATGGIPGSSVLLQVIDGRLELADQDPTSRTLEPFDPPLAAPWADLPPELYQDLPLVFPTDTTMTPDFPTAAALFDHMYSERTGTSVDAVLSVDPILVSRMLVGAPSIPVPGHEPVAPEDLAHYLLSTVYREFGRPDEAPARDALLAQVTASAFAEVLRQDPEALLGAVRKGVEDHRFQLWLTDPALQAEIAETNLAGRFPRQSDGFGVFRNDGTGGKLGFYSDGQIYVVASDSCTDGRRTFRLSADLTFSPADDLPEYVLGHAKAGPGVLRTNVMVFAPEGSEWGDVLVDGTPVPSVRTFQGGRPVAMVTLDQPGGTTHLTIDGSTDGRSVTDSLRVTPGMTDWSTTGEPIPSC